MSADSVDSLGRRAAVTAAADRVFSQLPKDFHPKDASAPKPQEILAEVFRRFQTDQADFRSYAFSEVIGLTIGQAIGTQIPRLLHTAEILDGVPEVDFGYADKRVRGLLNATDTKAFAGMTQNANYLVVLDRKYGEWNVHIREWFPDLREELQAGRYVGSDVMSAVSGKDVSHAMLIRAANGLRRYADDLDAERFPSRLGIESFRKARFLVGSAGGCPGLRYGDCRDVGYLASVKPDHRGCYAADRATSVDLGKLHYVWYDILSVMDTAEEELSRKASFPRGPRP